LFACVGGSRYFYLDWNLQIWRCLYDGVLSRHKRTYARRHRRPRRHPKRKGWSPGPCRRYSVPTKHHQLARRGHRARLPDLDVRAAEICSCPFEEGKSAAATTWNAVLARAKEGAARAPPSVPKSLRDCLPPKDAAGSKPCWGAVDLTSDLPALRPEFGLPRLRSEGAQRGPCSEAAATPGDRQA
jgi:hypothetical protein